MRMLINFKNILSFLLVGLFLFSVNVVNAQEVSTDAKPDKDHDKQDEFEILITYIEGNTETIHSEFYSDEVTGKPFIFKNNCERIYADQTKLIVLKNYKNEIQRGITFDNSWYFEIDGLTGPKLNVYNDRPYKQSFSNFYFRKGDGPMIKYSKTAMKTLFADNAEANKFAKKHLRNKGYQKLLTYTGMVVAVPGFLINPIVGSAGIVGGIGVSSAGFLFNKAITRDFFNAVRIYNQQW